LIFEEVDQKIEQNSRPKKLKIETQKEAKKSENCGLSVRANARLMGEICQKQRDFSV
jgi:hypothetical protein